MIIKEKTKQKVYKGQYFIKLSGSDSKLDKQLPMTYMFTDDLMIL